MVEQQQVEHFWIGSVKTINCVYLIFSSSFLEKFVELNSESEMTKSGTVATDWKSYSFCFRLLIWKAKSSPVSKELLLETRFCSGYLGSFWLPLQPEVCF